MTDAVHAEGSFIFLQLWALGRQADPNQLKSEDPDLPYVAPSAVKLSNYPIAPRPLTIDGEWSVALRPLALSRPVPTACLGMVGAT